MLRVKLVEAQQSCGEDLQIASLNDLMDRAPDENEEGKWRTLYDGTYGVHVNNRIWLRDSTGQSKVADVAAISEEVEEARRQGVSSFTIAWDYPDAHRIPRTSPQDWERRQPGWTRGTRRSI